MTTAADGPDRHPPAVGPAVDPVDLVEPADVVDLAELGLSSGGHLLVGRALAGRPPGGRLAVAGHDPALPVHLRAWCRQQGHGFEPGSGASGTGTVPVARDLGPPAGPPSGRGDGRPVPAARVAGTVVKGVADPARWASAERAGDPRVPVARASPTWGLAARGALVEGGGPPLPADLVERDVVWADIAPRLYAQAAANQWDPATAVDWEAPFELPVEVEAAVVQVMTYLVENEQAALAVPARFVARVHPHFREVVQLLAVQAADEARHVEVFTRRALLRSERLGRSGAAGRASLGTLLAEPDLCLATFLLSVLGEGTFLDLLGFLERHAPDPVTARIAHLARQDEARHVAFGVAHLEHAVQADPQLRGRLRGAVERRHDALRHVAGLDPAVTDALTVLAAGAWSPEAIARAWRAVQDLHARMDEGRRRRLVRLGFPPDEAAHLSSLHTRNFM